MNSSQKFDAIVVGGGVVGSSLAYHLGRGGCSTLLLDRLDRGRATDAGAGIISPETYGDKTEGWIDFAIQARDYYPSLVKQLENDGAAETGYAEPGILILAVGEDETDSFQRTRAKIFTRQQRRGRPAADDLRTITPEEAQHLFPMLARPRGAIHFRHAARVEGRVLNAALLEAGQAQRLRVRRENASRLLFEKRRVVGLETESGAYNTGAVIIAGGAWTADFGEQLGITIPVEPQRGQILHLGLSGVSTGHWPMVSAFHGHYLVPWPGGRVVAGATREPGSGFRPHSTAAGVKEALSEAIRVAPSLGKARLLEIRVGLRPMSPDGSPILGAVPGQPNVYLATGHGPTGLTLGPYSGKVIADQILRQPTQSDLSAFSVTRFL